MPWPYVLRQEVAQETACSSGTHERRFSPVSRDPWVQAINASRKSDRDLEENQKAADKGGEKKKSDDASDSAKEKKKKNAADRKG